MDFPGSREVKVFVVILIAIIITVPTAYYFLQRPYNPPITVQNGFAEYNWTSDRFFNASYVGFEGTWVNFTDLAAIAKIVDPQNKTSTLNLSMIQVYEIYELATREDNSTYFEFRANLRGVITPGLIPSSLDIQLNSSLPMMTFPSSKIPQEDDLVIYNSLYQSLPVNISMSHQDIIQNESGESLLLINDSKKLKDDYHFQTYLDIFVDLLYLKHNTTYPIILTATLNGLQHPVSADFELNIRGTD